MLVLIKAERVLIPFEVEGYLTLILFALQLSSYFVFTLAVTV